MAGWRRVVGDHTTRPSSSPVERRYVCMKYRAGGVHPPPPRNRATGHGPTGKPARLLFAAPAAWHLCTPSPTVGSQQAGIEARYDKTRQSQMAVSKTQAFLQGPEQWRPARLTGGHFVAPRWWDESWGDRDDLTGHTGLIQSGPPWQHGRPGSHDALGRGGGCSAQFVGSCWLVQRAKTTTSYLSQRLQSATPSRSRDDLGYDENPHTWSKATCKRR